MQIVKQVNQLQQVAQQIEDDELRQRLLISLNNICKSIGHVSAEDMHAETSGLGVSHG